MGLPLGTNFELNAEKFNFERDSFATLAEMKAFPLSSVPDGFQTFCEQDFNHYIMCKGCNPSDETGYWRNISTVTDFFDNPVDEFNYSRPVAYGPWREDRMAIVGALTNKVDKVTGKGLSTNDYTTAEKQKLASLSNYNDSSVVKSIKINGETKTPIAGLVDLGNVGGGGASKVTELTDVSNASSASKDTILTANGDGTFSFMEQGGVDVANKADLYNYHPYDGEVKNGYWNADGNFIANSAYIAFECMSSEIEYVKFKRANNSNIDRIIIISEDDVIISSITATSSDYLLFKLPTSCKSIRFSTSLANQSSVMVLRTERDEVGAVSRIGVGKSLFKSGVDGMTISGGLTVHNKTWLDCCSDIGCSFVFFSNDGGDVPSLTLGDVFIKFNWTSMDVWIGSDKYNFGAMARSTIRQFVCLSFNFFEKNITLLKTDGSSPVVVNLTSDQFNSMIDIMSKTLVVTNAPASIKHISIQNEPFTQGLFIEYINNGMLIKGVPNPWLSLPSKDTVNIPAGTLPIEDGYQIIEYDDTYTQTPRIPNGNPENIENRLVSFAFKVFEGELTDIGVSPDSQNIYAILNNSGNKVGLPLQSGFEGIIFFNTRINANYNWWRTISKNTGCKLGFKDLKIEWLSTRVLECTSTVVGDHILHDGDVCQTARRLIYGCDVDPLISSTSTNVEGAYIGHQLIVGQDLYTLVALPKTWKKITP